MGFHSLSFRTFCQATEDESKVTRALKFASATETVERTVSEGFHGNKIVVLFATLRAQKEIARFFLRLSNEDLALLSETLNKRMDEEGNLFLRLDKQRAFLGELRLSGSEDIISVRGSVKAYPKRREIALGVADEYLKGLLGQGGQVT